MGTNTYQFLNGLNEIYSSSSSDLYRLGFEEQTNDAFWERHKNEKIELFNKKNINVEGSVVDFKGHKAVMIKFDGSNLTGFNKTKADQFFETAKNIK